MRTAYGLSTPVLSGEGRHILVVDDDDGLRPLLLSLLRRNGFRATGARSGGEMRDILGAAPVDLVLLDVMLPDRPGFELCRELRAAGRIPIILLTALGEALDRIVGLELGADDFVVKPADPRELIARIRAVLRRTDSSPGPGEPRREVARFAGWLLDTRRRELVRADGAIVELTSGEFDLLHTFVERPGRVLTRDQLLDLARNRPFGGLERSMDAQVSRLRTKLAGGQVPAPVLIKTVRSVGYLFAGAVEWS